MDDAPRWLPVVDDTVVYRDHVFTFKFAGIEQGIGPALPHLLTQRAEDGTPLLNFDGEPMMLLTGNVEFPFEVHIDGEHPALRGNFMLSLEQWEADQTLRVPELLLSWLLDPPLVYTTPSRPD